MRAARHNSGRRWVGLLVAAGGAWAAGSAPAQVQPITSATVTYQTYSNTNDNYSTTGGGSAGFPTGTVYNVRFNEGVSNQMFLGEVMVGGRTFDGIALAGQINIARATNAAITGKHHIVLYEQSSFSGTNVFLKSRYAPTMEESLRSRLINHGADNVFSDQGDGNGNNNNIQRIDYLFPDGLPVHSHIEQRGFLVMDRGGNDRFKIAAITGVDGNGQPTAFGTPVSVLETQWGASGVSLDTIVMRGYTENGDPQHPSADVSPQPLSGVFLNWQTLGLQTNDLFYGYALVGNDTTTNGALWVDVQNPVNFPTNTSPDSTFGGLDLISGGVMFYDEALNVTLGDRAWDDLDADGLQEAGEPGVSNVLVYVYDGASNLAAVVRTDTNGVWTSPGHGPGTYFAKFFLPDGYEFTARYAGSDPAIDSDADLATGLTASFAMGTGQTNLTLDAGMYRRATLGDFVWEDLDGDGQQDGGEPGLADVVVRLFNAASNVIGTTTSSVAGAYAFTNLLPGAYFVDFTPPAGYFFTTANAGADATDSDPLPGTNRTALVALVSGQTQTTVDAGFWRPAYLGDYTWADVDGDGQQGVGEPGLSNVVVRLYDAASNVVGVTTSSASWAYGFANLAPGSYFVGFTAPAGYIFTTPDAGNDVSDSDAAPSTGRTTPRTLASGQEDVTIDAGFVRPAALGDFTWEDANGNGQQDGGEPGLANVVVRLYNATSNVVGTTTSSVAGAYAFTNLFPGAYFVGFTPPAGYVFTFADTGADATDSDADAVTGYTALVALTNGQTEATVDAGFVQPAALGNYAWVDSNFNGQQDGGEPALANVVVRLYDAASNVVGTTTSSVAGIYAFTNLSAGTYFVGFTPPAGWSFTTANAGADATDSDADPATGFTPPVVLSGGQVNTTVDAGFYDPASVSLKLFKSSSLSGNWDFGATNDYYLTLQNTGTVALAGVALTDALPPGASFVAGSAQIVQLTAVTTNPFVETVSDGFGTASYANNDGTANWLGNWSETGDNGSVANGNVLVRVAGSTNALVFENTGADNDYVTRTNVLAAAAGRVYTNVTLSFAYRRQNWDAGDSFTFYVSTNGFVGQSNLVFAVPTTSGNDAAYVQVSTNLTSRMGANLALRLRAGGTFGYNDRINFDFVTFTNSGYDVATNTLASYVPGATVTVVSNLVSATPADLLSNYVLPAGSSVTVRIQATLGAPLVSTQLVNTATATNPVTPPLVASVTNVSVANAVGDRAWDDANANGLQDGGETGVTGATVRIYGAASNLLATTATDANGAYSFTNLPTGSYFLEFWAAGYYATVQDQGGNDALDSDIDAAGRTAAFTLSGGTNDTSRDAGGYLPAALGDFAWVDANGNGQQDGGEPGLSNVVVTLYDAASNVLGVTTSSVSGAYAFTNLVPGSYFVAFAPPSGYLFTTSNVGADATDSDVLPGTNRTALVTLVSGQNDPALDAGFYRPASLGDYTWVDSNFNGQQDGGEPGLASVVVTLYDAASNLVGTTTASVAGAYAFTNLAPGAYFAGFVPPPGYLFTTANAGADATDSDPLPGTNRTALVTLVSGQADATVDAGFYQLAALGDTTWVDGNFNGQQDGGEPGLSNVVVRLYDAASNVVGTTTSTVAGGYAFADLLPGAYFVGFTAPADYFFTTANVGADATDSDADPSTGWTEIHVLTSGQTNLTLDAGFYRRAALGDFAWEDLDGDGQQDGGEPGLADVVVRLFNAASNVIGTTTSSVAGAYAFADLLPGAYFVDFTPPAGYFFTASNVGADATDSDPLPGTNRTALVALVSGQTETTVDAGFYRPASLGDYTWEDSDVDGQQQDGREPGLADVVVTLYDAVSNVVGTTTSSAVGAYAFTDLPPGTYFAGFALPAGYRFTTANVGDDATDSDADPATGLTAPVLLQSGQTDGTVDAGFILPAALGDFTWLDSDNDGQQDGGEPGLADVVVTLYDAASNVVGVATSSAAGAYAFADLPPGTYFVGFTPPAGYQFTTANAGADATDSDPDPLTGLTAPVLLQSGQNDLTVDAGFVLPASLGDYTWVDGDFNGQQDGGEPALADVVVTLYDAVSNVVGTTTSSAAGAYAFTDLPPGIYFVGFAPPTGYQLTTANVGADATDSDADPATGRTAPFALTNGQTDATIDAGFYNPASVSLKLFKSSSLSGNWNLGETNDYYLTLQNTGTVALAGVSLTDVLPPGVSFVSDSAQIVRMTTVMTNSFAGTVSDGFGTVSYANNDGTANWLGNWAEVGDNASAASGSVLVRVAGGTNALVFENSSADNDHVTRTNVLAAAPGRVYTNVTLSFAYRRQNWDSGDSFTFYVSTNGFVGQSNLVFAVPTTAGTDAGYVDVQLSTNLTSVTGFDLALRLRAGGSFGYGDRINVDYVTIAHSGYDVATNPATTYAPGVTVNVVSNLAGATPANLLSNYALPAGSSVTVRIQATLDVPLVATQFVNVALATNPATPPLTASVTNVSVANAVGDRTWFDADGDGIQDGGEPGLTGVTVRIYGIASNLIATTTSGVAGAYAFANLPSGSYFLAFDAPSNHVVSAQDQGGSDALDSDVDPATGRTATFALDGGTNDPNWDAGFYQPSSSIGNFVWRDLNIDGLQSGGSETGMPGVVVRLYDGASNLVATTTSLVTGAYGFTGVPTATYFLEFAAPPDFNFTLRDQGGDDALDSDAAPATGRTAPFFLPAGTNDLRWDAGLVEIVYGLQLTKTSDAGSCLSPGDTITYTLTVANTGNVAQTGIAVEDLLPPGLTYVADSGQAVLSNSAVRTVRDEFNAVSYAGQDGTETWPVDWQENDPYGTVGPVGNYVGVAGNRLTIHYAYVGDEAAWRWADLGAETNATLSFDWETVGLDANEYLDVQIATGPGGPFTQLQAFGGTASGSASYDVTAYLSTGTTIRIEATPGTENWESGEYGYLDNVEFSSTWQSVTTNSVSAPPSLLSGQALTAGGTLTVTFQATVDAPGTVSQLVNVATAYSPRQPAIQAAVTNCVVTADVGVEKSVTDATPDMLQVIEYTLVASNNGPAVATGVVLTDVLPAQVEYNSHSNGTYSVTSGEWTIGTLAVNASTAITFNVTVREHTSGLQITNVAAVTGRDLFDPVPDNDTSSVVIVPNPGVNIGDRIWFDANRDGIQNTGETNGIADIPVVLLDDNGKERAATVTDSQGYYLFTNMPPGTYLVRFDLASISTNDALSSAKAGEDDELDSDAIAGNVGDVAWTALFSVTSGETTHAIDLGLTTRGTSRAELAAAWGEWTDGQGRVAWRTESEFSTAGFFVYRVDPETGAETRLNERLHLSTFREGGSTYGLADPEAREGATGTYRLEEKELSGEIRDLGMHEIRFDVWTETARSARTGAAPEEAASPTARAASRASPGLSPVQKVRVRNDGIYGVDLQALADGMGLSFAAVQALAETNGLAIAKHGVPVPAIYDAVRGQLVFRGEAPAPNWYVHDSAYLISAGVGLAMPRREPGATGGATVFPVQLTFEEDLFLFSMNQMPEDFYFWAGVMSGYGELSVNRFPLDLTGYAGGDLTLNIRLMGWSSSLQHPDHLAVFGFNGTAAGSIAFDGQEAVEAVLTIPAAAVSNGVNTLTVEGVLQEGRTESFFVVDRIEASFDRALAPASPPAVFSADGAGSVSASAFAEPLALALDADGQPTWIADENGELPAKAWAVVAGDERFAVAELAGIPPLAPESAAADAWFLSETNQIDYLVIASRALAATAQDLADYRAGQGLRAGVAVFEDICDLLAGGDVTPEAIPALLGHAARTWAKSPDMVVLAGNGHYDYLQANTGEANHLPPLLAQTPAGVCASDGRLADVDGDALPDVAIGRLPARTPTELAAMLAKIQAYETGFGSAWQNQISLAADPADAAGDFSAENDLLAALATDPYAVAARIDLDDMALGPARTNFMSWFNAGVGFIHFAGHGDLKTLGKSNLLSSANVGALTNALRPPILVSLTCLAARYEVPSVSSLGEALLQRAGGGAVAVLGPSGLSLNAPASELGNAFYAAVFQEGSGRLGPAFLRARRALPASLFTENTLAVYNLLGDPALRIAGNEASGVPPAEASVTLSDLEQAYNGAPRVVSATTVPAGLAVRITYDGSTAPPTAAGTYAVAATVGTASYEGSATGLLVVAKAPAAVELGDLAQTYAGTGRIAAATTEPAGLAVSFTYDGAATPPVAAGHYQVVGTVADVNYEGAATGLLVVARASATVALDGLDHVYDGAPKTASALTDPAGLAVVWTYDGDCTAPVGAGSYEAVAEIDEANFVGSATGTLVVAKAAATVVLEDLAQTYDGAPRLAAATTVPAGLAVAHTYDGSEIAPTAAGTYAVTGTIHDANYAGSATGTLEIAKAVATVMLDNLTQPYDGMPKRAAALTDPWELAVDLTYDGGGAAPMAQGSYAVSAIVLDANFTGSAAGTLVISAPLDPFGNWLHQRGLDPEDENFASQEDDDGDGRTTWEEYVADTSPNDADEVFAVEGRYAEDTGTIHLAFPASPDRFYQLEYSTNLSSPTIVRDLGWGGTGIYATNAPGEWFGTIRVRLAAP